ncbi:MAG: adenosine deaminase [Candidatus Eremiobacteraeota bacterium]|nr:adenosine deaminase [Candidatus Eremiobacteraeota bacterium]
MEERHHDGTLEWLERIPKVELHLHLEGAIPLDTLWTLVEKYGGTGDVPSLGALREKFVYRSFPQFIATWSWKNSFIREYEDFTLFSEAVARHLAAQGIRYAECFFSPGDFSRRNLSTSLIAEAIRGGLSKVPEIEVALIADLVRDFGPCRGERTLDEATEVRHLGIIGIGIGGSEQQYPPEAFTRVYKKAERLGFHTTAHAGEAAGAPSIWGALRSLGVERIGHGTRAFEDDDLVRYLGERQVPLELCPLSNVATGVVASLEEHPVARYFRLGLKVTVNTDDPAMFGTSLAGEYRALMRAFGLTREDIRKLILNAIESSWCSRGEKEKRAGEFSLHPSWKEEKGA